MSDTTANTHLTSTIESLSKGLTHAKAGASRSIHSWVETLNASKAPALHTLAGELKQLDTLLSGDKVSGPALKKALASIGQHTTASASSADGATADKIKQIGKLLTEAAASLS
ncbi:hypothetical protein BEN49_02975 [Hymenobacter coccineus]|uniref:Uncharacterized protein n=2 Tax=Hymenobacter coccineus TaxID=1908235 RepID=A0A1G1SU16_9BACT|nr:hypothetical protein BEN49_02975 [Hymenobacter coccineus]